MRRYRPGLGSEIGAAGTAAANAVAASIRGRRSDVKGRVFEGVLLLTLLVSLGVLVALVTQVSAVGYHVFAERGLDFFASPLSSLSDRAGIGQGLRGSLYLMVFVVVLAFPLGIGAAIYLEEYAGDTWFTRFLRANIRNLAGVPSIVYGILGLAIFVLALRSITGSGGLPGTSVISGGLTLSILVLPLVIITSSEALRAVPDSIREAGYAVGATRWEVIRSHVLPSAAPGILTGTILALARALGETAPLLLIGAITGFFFQSSGGFAEQLHGPYTTLPTVVFTWSRLPGEGFRQNAAAAIMVLMALILVVNTLAILLRNRYDRRW